MQNARTFKVTSSKVPEGVLYYYHKDTGLFEGIEILQRDLAEDARIKTIASIILNVNNFIGWAKKLTETNNDVEVIELATTITFDMLWLLYDDKLRSSKKRSKAIWDKLSIEEQIKAYYHVYKYFRNRGNAEKKYLETYLRAEQWNN